MIPYRVQVDNAPVDGYAIVYNAASPDQHLYAPVASPTYVNAGDLATLNSAKAYTDASVATLTGTLTEVAQDAIGASLVDSASVDFTYTDAANQITAVVLPSGVNHNALANLAVGDFHTQYALLAGRAAGQTLYGGTGAGENLTLTSTSNATKGFIYFGTGAAYDGANVRFGVGTQAPKTALSVYGANGIVVGRSAADSATAPTTIATSYYLEVGGQEYGVNSYRLIGFGYRAIPANTFHPAYVGYQEMDSTAAGNGDLIFGTRAGNTDVVPTERMRITAAGSVGIGGTPATYKFEVVGDGYFNSTSSAGKVYFPTNGTNIYVGTAAQQFYIHYGSYALNFLSSQGAPASMSGKGGLSLGLTLSATPAADGGLRAQGQSVLASAGSAANDATQDAVRVQPSTAKLANYRPYTYYALSTDTLPTWVIDNSGYARMSALSSTQVREVAWFEHTMPVTTDATRTGRFRLMVADFGVTTGRELLRCDASGAGGQITAQVPLAANFGLTATLAGSGTTFQAVNTIGMLFQGILTAAAAGVVTIASSIEFRPPTSASPGFGAREQVLLASDTTNSQNASARDTTWVVATHASRRARQSFLIGDSVQFREAFRFESDGTTAFTTIPATVPVSANYGLLSVGGGAWDGATAGFFVGTSTGTAIAVNAASGFGGNLLDVQVAGSQKLRLTSVGGLRPVFLEFTTTPASSGSIRFSNTDSIWARNNAGTSDIRILQSNAFVGSNFADALTIGGSTTSKVSVTAAASGVFQVNNTRLAVDYQGSASNDLTQYSALIQPSGALAANWGPFAIALSSSQTVPEVSIDKYGSLVIAKAGVTVNSVANGTTFFTSESAPGGNSGMVVASPSTAITIPVLGTSGAVGLVAAAASVGGNRPGVGVHGYGLFNVTNTGVGNSPKGGYFLGETGASAVTFAGSAYGVHGKADTSKGTTNGVGTGNAYGLYGEAVGQANNTCYGVFGTASGGTQNWAIYAANGLQVAAASSTSTTEYINCGAGKFSVQTDRTLSGAGKGAFGNSSGEIGLHNWNNKVSIYVGSPLLERFRVNLDGTINSVYQHAFTYTGSAANDVTQDAVQVRPSAALAANYRGLALYPTSAASTPNTWTDTRCGINSAISYDFSSADAILHSFTGTLTGTSPSGNSNRLFSATMFLSPSGTVAARTIAAGNFVADLLSNASFGGGSGSTLIAISASSDNNHATLSWDVTQGVNSQAGTTRVGGTVTTAQCYVARPLYTGTTTNAYGYYAMSPAGGGTLVNAYGVYIESQAVASTLKYGLYQAGTGDLNLFAGTVGIGASAEPRTSLYLSSAQLDGATPCAIKIGATFFGSGINYSILSIPGVRFSTTTTEFRHYGAQNIAASGGALPAGYIQTGLYIDDMTAATTNYAIYTKAGTVRVGDDLKLATVGKGLYVKEGANATMGVATLIGGTVVVNTTKVTATSRIYLTGQNASGTIGELGISARVVGTSFTITSLSGTDTRDVAWMIVEPA